MSGYRADHYHHSSSEVQGYLEEALRLVTVIEVTDELLVPAFTEAVRLLASKTVTIEQVQGALDHLRIPVAR